MPVVLGRSPQATYCIDDSRVSRSHARIDWHGGAYQLTDLSYNGTYVRFSGGSEVVALRRSTCTLHGSGAIGLGLPPTDAARRRCVSSFSDTLPHHPSTSDECSLVPDEASPLRWLCRTTRQCVVAGRGLRA
jgi:pSer/pThr/pTyr-binding forkhead associated (FHA) protein